MRSYAFLDSPGPIAFAHRGSATGGVENSLVAFQQAVDLGYRYLETDVQVTADGELLAFHDRVLDRATDRAGVIARLPFREVRRARIAGREPIPRLTDILDAFPHTRLNLDVKDLPVVEPLVNLVRRTGCHDRVCIASFSDRRLARVRTRLGPAVATSFGPRGVLALRVATHLPLLRRLVRADVPCVQIPVRARGIPLVTPRFLDVAHGLGLQVHVWTIDDPAEMARLLDLGVDGIMTDEPARLRDVLTARGEW